MIAAALVNVSITCYYYYYYYFGCYYCYSFNVGLEFPKSLSEKYASVVNAVSMDTGTVNGKSVVLNDLLQ